MKRISVDSSSFVRRPRSLRSLVPRHFVPKCLCPPFGLSRLLLGGAIVGATFLIARFWGYNSWEAWWASNVFHLGGGAYAFFFIRALFERTRARHGIQTKPWVEAILFVSGAIVLGVAWEWYELLIDRYNVIVRGRLSIMSYADNIGDLGIDALGALLGAYFFLARKKSREKDRT